MTAELLGAATKSNDRPQLECADFFICDANLKAGDFLLNIFYTAGFILLCLHVRLLLDNYTWIHALGSMSVHTWNLQ
jgi:hypothetical protein